MSVRHPTAVRDSVCNLVVDKLDLGASFPNAIMVIQQISPALDLVTLNFAAKATGAFGPSSTGTASATGLPIEATVTASGTAQKAVLYDCNGPTRNEICSCDVSASGGSGDIQLSSVNLTLGDLVRISTLTYSAPL